MSWKSHTNGFRSFLQIEKSLSTNSVSAYESDLRNHSILEVKGKKVSPKKIKSKDIREFIMVALIGLSAKSNPEF